MDAAGNTNDRAVGAAGGGRDGVCGVSCTTSDAPRPQRCTGAAIRGKHQSVGAGVRVRVHGPAVRVGDGAGAHGASHQLRVQAQRGHDRRHLRTQRRCGASSHGARGDGHGAVGARRGTGADREAGDEGLELAGHRAGAAAGDGDLLSSQHVVQLGQRHLAGPPAGDLHDRAAPADTNRGGINVPGPWRAEHLRVVHGGGVGSEHHEGAAVHAGRRRVAAGGATKVSGALEGVCDVGAAVGEADAAGSAAVRAGWHGHADRLPVRDAERRHEAVGLRVVGSRVSGVAPHRLKAAGGLASRKNLLVEAEEARAAALELSGDHHSAAGDGHTTHQAVRTDRDAGTRGCRTRPQRGAVGWLQDRHECGVGRRVVWVHGRNGDGVHLQALVAAEVAGNDHRQPTRRHAHCRRLRDAIVVHGAEATAPELGGVDSGSQIDGGKCAGVNGAGEDVAAAIRRDAARHVATHEHLRVGRRRSQQRVVSALQPADGLEPQHGTVLVVDDSREAVGAAVAGHERVHTAERDVGQRQARGAVTHHHVELSVGRGCGGTQAVVVGSAAHTQHAQGTGDVHRGAGVVHHRKAVVAVHSFERARRRDDVRTGAVEVEGALEEPHSHRPRGADADADVEADASASLRRRVGGAPDDGVGHGVGDRGAHTGDVRARQRVGARAGGARHRHAHHDHVPAAARHVLGAGGEATQR